MPWHCCVIRSSVTTHSCSLMYITLPLPRLHYQLEMWVDIFPKMDGVSIPPAVSIEQRVAKPYQLRIIIWNTKVTLHALFASRFCLKLVHNLLPAVCDVLRDAPP